MALSTGKPSFSISIAYWQEGRFPLHGGEVEGDAGLEAVDVPEVSAPQRPVDR